MAIWKKVMRKGLEKKLKSSFKKLGNRLDNRESMYKCYDLCSSYLKPEKLDSFVSGMDSHIETLMGDSEQGQSMFFTTIAYMYCLGDDEIEDNIIEGLMDDIKSKLKKSYSSMIDDKFKEYVKKN